MTITNITPRETELQRELSLARGEASVWKDQVTYDQAELKTVWRMNDALKAEVAALKANLEKEQSLTAHHRTVQVELLSKVEVLKAKLAELDKPEPEIYGYVSEHRWLIGDNSYEFHFKLETIYLNNCTSITPVYTKGTP